MKYPTSLLLSLGLLSLVAVSCTQTEPILDRVEIAPFDTDTLYTGRTYQLRVETQPASDAPRLSWSVSDASLATVQYGGVLKPLRKGELTVTVHSLQSGGKRLSSSRKYLILSSGVYLRDRTVTLNPQEEYQLPYRFLPEDYRPEETLSWSSADPAVAIVDATGRVRALQDGETTIHVRLGNPLSGFYSDDSVALVVRTHQRAAYTYKDNVLDLKQEVPGLLPMTARDLPYFSKIVLHGPINGSDLLFFIENKAIINELDLSDTHLVKGGRTTTVKADHPTEPDVTYQVEDDVLPRGFAEQLRIARVTMPRGIKAPIHFGVGHIFDELIFPSGYEQIRLELCAIRQLVLPAGLKSFTCNMGSLLFRSNGQPVPLSLFENGFALPEGLRELRLLAKVDQPLSIPATVEQIMLGGQYDEVDMSACQRLRTLDPSILPHLLYWPGWVHLSVQRLLLPEGLERIGAQTFSMGLQKLLGDKRAYGTIAEVVFPRSLREIGSAAFFAVKISAPLQLNEGLQEIGSSTFMGSTIPEVTLPKSLRKIGDQAFALCEHLDRVRSLAPQPPALGSAAFARSAREGVIPTLYVPRGSKGAYQRAGYASHFYEIIEE